VRPVEGRGDLTRFIKLPFRLHRDSERWVPPLIMERREFLNPKKNPYFEHAEVQLFLAWREGEPVGRISAQIDSRWDQYQGGNDGIFGLFEAEDDPDVAAALLDTAAAWLRERGRDRMLGPLDFTTNDECGVLVDGFDQPAMILEPWHPPHYGPAIEAAGFGKAMDLWMWRLEMGDLKEGNAFHPMIHAAAEKVENEHRVTIRNMRKNDLENEVRTFMDVYNEAWGDNWGFVPITDAEADFQAKNLKPVLDERWTFIAERDGEVLGAALTLPDINQVLAKMNGHLLPFGWWHFLTRKRKIDRVRVFALGVKPEYQHLGIAASFYVRHMENTGLTGIMWAHTGWILETNKPMNGAMEGMGGEVIKTYRIYEKDL
jgi:ribosomal protein S18 acetylase RimI-like enzyme